MEYKFYNVAVFILIYLLLEVIFLTVSILTGYKRKPLGVYILFTILAICSITIDNIVQETPKEVVSDVYNHRDSIEHTFKLITFEDSVKHYIQDLNIRYPDIVLKQARLESGNFQSVIFKENNNMFGFKQAYKRPNTQIGVNKGYAVYENWKECIMDYALYQTYSAKNLTKEEYLNFLGKYYAEDINYVYKLNNINDA